jgi:hypothetical protein
VALRIGVGVGGIGSAECGGGINVSYFQFTFYYLLKHLYRQAMM